MKLTESMLREFVTTPLSCEEIGDLLTMTGFELEEIFEAEGEKVLDINITANRGDGASVLGLSRELLAKDPQAQPTELYRRFVEGCPVGDESTPLAGFRVLVETPDCGRFTGRIFEGVTNGDSPDWLQKRLRQIGQRPISLLVDLTNLVMMETGQPMHAYDLDLLASRTILVRPARRGEKVTTLDGVERNLEPWMMMICDEKKPIGVAGVMGGADTEVSAGTTRCFLESAHFDHRSVRKTRKALGMHTEASYRFERFVDPEGPVRAMNRFAELLEKCGGPTPSPGVIDVSRPRPKPLDLRLRVERTNRLLGMDVEPDVAVGYLRALGNEVTGGPQEFIVTPPSWRIDLEREDDLIEEVGRIHGYEKIPEALPIGSTPVGGSHGRYAMTDRLREQLVRCGYTQCVSHSLRDLHPLDKGLARTRVRTPHSPEMAHLRDSVLPSLGDSALRNLGRDGLWLFEVGKVFSDGVERTELGLLATGKLDPPSWVTPTRGESSFFTVKPVLEAVLASVGLRSVCFKPSADRRLHPTRQASIGGFGILGQIHPDIAEDTGLAEDAVLAEINVEALLDVPTEETGFHPVHRHPAVRRDIAVLVDKSVPYEAMERAAREAAGDVLEDLWLFDVYEGKGIEPGFHSLALALQLRKAGNFTDEEANQVRDSVVAALVALGATLR